MGNNTYINILLGILITFISYEIIPFVICFFFEKKFDEKGAKRLAIINSIIVGSIFFALTTIYYDSSAWSVVPAYIYYMINSRLWISKEYNEKIDDHLFDDEKFETLEEKLPSNKTLKCENCGAIIKDNLKECPNCGEIFEEDLDIIYDKALKDILLNKTNAKKLFIEYIEKAEKKIKEYDEKCYTFNNNLEFVIAIKLDLIDNNCVNTNFKLSDAYLNLAIILFDEKKYEEAIKLIKKSIEYNPVNLSSIFELAENYKELKKLDKFYECTTKSYEFIYDISQLARYYRNLGYYYIEKENWELSKALYLYSLKYENSEKVTNEIGYIISKTNDKNLPKKDELTSILRENDIPTFISKNNLNIIKKLYSELEEKNELDSNFGKFITSLMDKNANN